MNDNTLTQTLTNACSGIMPSSCVFRDEADIKGFIMHAYTYTDKA